MFCSTADRIMLLASFGLGLMISKSPLGYIIISEHEGSISGSSRNPDGVSLGRQIVPNAEVFVRSIC